MISFLKLGRGGVLGQGKGSSSWVKKWLIGILAATGYGSVKLVNCVGNTLCKIGRLSEPAKGRLPFYQF